MAELTPSRWVLRYLVFLAMFTFGYQLGCLAYPTFKHLHVFFVFTELFFLLWIVGWLWHLKMEFRHRSFLHISWVHIYRILRGVILAEFFLIGSLGAFLGYAVLNLLAGNIHSLIVPFVLLLAAISIGFGGFILSEHHYMQLLQKHTDLEQFFVSQEQLNIALKIAAFLIVVVIFTPAGIAEKIYATFLILSFPAFLNLLYQLKLPVAIKMRES